LNIRTLPPLSPLPLDEGRGEFFYIFRDKPQMIPGGRVGIDNIEKSLHNISTIKIAFSDVDKIINKSIIGYNALR